MSVAIRLRREGSKNRPFYRVVVADKKNRRDGRFIEILGTYNPISTQEKNWNFDVDRADYWVGVGAQPSETVRSLMRKARRWDIDHPDGVETPKAAAPAPAAEVKEEAPKAEAAAEAPADAVKSEEAQEAPVAAQEAPVAAQEVDKAADNADLKAADEAQAESKEEAVAEEVAADQDDQPKG